MNLGLLWNYSGYKTIITYRNRKIEKLKRFSGMDDLINKFSAKRRKKCKFNLNCLANLAPTACILNNSL